MKRYKYAFGILLIFLFSCSSLKTSKTTTPEKLVSIIEKELGLGAKHENNFDNTYVLAWREDDTSGTLVIRYGVWAIISGELLYADSAIRGSVKWLDNTSLLVEDYPGIIDGEQQNFKFKIDLNTKIKTPLHEKEDI